MSTTAFNALLTFLIAMVPVIELRGALPFGVARGLPLPLALSCAILGNLLPIPFIILFIRRIFSWLRQRSPRLNTWVNRMEDRAMSKADRVQRYAFWGLCLFVAIPLPGTGAWTGALIAALLEIPTKRAFLAITLGVLIAALIVSTLTYGVGALFF